MADTTKPGMGAGARRGRRAGLLLAAALTLAAGASDRAAAAPTDTVFTVANYPVEARADNAAAAKDKALADGQQAAFRSLLKRLVPVTAYARIKRLAGVKAGDLVDGFRVRSERNSSTDYIASLDFYVPVEGRARPAAPRGHPVHRRAGPRAHHRSGLARGGWPARPRARPPGPMPGRASTSSTR